MKAFTLIAIMLLVIPGALATVYHDYYGPYGGDDFITWQEDYFTNNKSHATPPFAPQQTFGGCYISTGHGLLDDRDCDKVPDIADNCLGIPNTDQGDQNQNSIGDACDLIVDAIKIDPPVVLEGRAFIVTATLTNYRSYDLRNIKLTLQVPELGLEQETYLDTFEAGKQGKYDFYLRLPDCVKQKEYDVVLFVEWPKSPGTKESFYIPTKMGVSASGLCKDAVGTADDSVINILDIQDVDPVKGGIYPFTIVNNEQESQAYVLTVDGLDDWGTYEIQPRSLIVVPAGESREGQLVVYAKKGSTGKQGFLLTLRSKHDAQQVQLTAHAEESLPGPSARYYAQFGLFIIGAIIIIVAFFFVAREQERRKKR